ncbi:MAG: carbohydrate ABC transporter permease [Oscillospiraceae bacterium]|nr:carbohydrate ABC transporter permease [Oscillospiraceae bacterium]
MSNGRRTSRVVLYIVLCLGVLLTVFPFIWMVLTSFKLDGEAVQVPPTILPQHPSLQAYQQVFDVIPFRAVLLNSVISTVLIVLGQVLFCTMAAYGFARIKFPGRQLIFILVLSVLMVPSQIFLIPQYLIIQKLHLLDTMGGLVLPSLFSAFGTFLLRQFFLSIPAEMEEAAILDGANRWQIFTKVMVPLVQPGIVTLVIFTAKYGWNNFMWPLIITTTPSKMTLGPALSTLSGVHVNNYPAQMAGAVLAVIPMLILFIVFQKQFIEGVAHAGVKG